MPRRHLATLLSEESHEGWLRFAASRHVTVSALLEALGHELARLDAEGLLATGALRRAVESAALLSAQRRSRRPS